MDKNELEKFNNLVKSLSLYNRHSVSNISDGLDLKVSDIYIDPFPSGGTPERVLGSKFSIVLGRKGTGKSVLFDVCQEKLIAKGKSVGVYVNCFNVYQDHSYDISEHVERLVAANTGLVDEKQVEEYLYRRGLVKGILAGLVEQIQKKATETWAERLKEVLGVTKYGETISRIGQIQKDIESPKEEEIRILKSAIIKTSTENSAGVTTKNESSGTISTELSLSGIKVAPKVGGKSSSENTSGNKASNYKEYSTVLLQVFKPKALFVELFNVLKLVGIEKLHLFFDDFSELNEEYQGVLSNSLFAQIHQWHDFNISLSVAGYPNRCFLGNEVDAQKVDVVKLDFNDVYHHLDFSEKHSEGMSFVKNLISNRLSVFCDSAPLGHYFDFKTDQENDIYLTLFQATYNSPRLLGKILSHCANTSLRSGKKISVSAIKSAAETYFLERLKFFSKTNQFSYRDSDVPFRSPLEVLSQLELLDKIVEKQKENQSAIQGTRYKDLGKTPPVSHFHVSSDIEEYFDFLWNNYFLNKLGELSVKKDKIVASVFALNLGLCEHNRITYWRPLAHEYRDYLKERFFFFDEEVKEYLSSTRKIVCSSCSAVFPFTEYDVISRFKWRCPSCDTPGSCQVSETILDKSKVLEKIDPARLPEVEIKMLDAIKELEGQSLSTFTKDVAGEVDCSYQLVSYRMKKLVSPPFELVIVDEMKDSSGRSRKYYKLTPKAKGTYF